MNKNYVKIYRFAIKAGGFNYVVSQLLTPVLLLDTVIKLHLIQDITVLFERKISGSLSITDVGKTLSGYFFLFVLLYICDLVRSRQNIRSNNKLENAFKLYKNSVISGLNWESYEKTETYQKILSVNEKSLNAFLYLTNDLMQYVLLLLYLLFYCVSLLKVNVIFMMITLGSFLAVAVIRMVISKQQITVWRDIVPYYQKAGYLNKIMLDRSLHQEQLYYRLYPFLSKDWWFNREQARRFLGKTDKKIAKLHVAGDVFYCFAFILCINYAVFVNMRDGVREISSITLLAAMLLDIGNRFQTFISRINSSIVEMKYISMLYWIKEEGNKQCTPKIVLDSFETITMRNISYRYPGACRDAIRNISLQIRRGEKIALIGSNGGGKSTLVNVLIGLTCNYAGEYFIDDQKMDFSIHGLNRLVSCVFQDFGQYQMTVKENIQLGCIERELTDEEVEEILMLVGADEFVKTLPYGYNTRLGQLTDSSTDFSKGQWQRIAIGRLLANKKSKIWILDEPSAWLDPVAEVELYRLIQKLGLDKTIIFVSHRLGFCKFADRVVMLDNGCLEAVGNHQELLSGHKKYQQMFSAQESNYA